jgi:hypothetical protein
MKVIVVEPQCKNVEHLVFNSSVLLMLRNIFPHDAITLYAENEHIQYLRERVAIKSFGFELPRGTGHILTVKKILFDLFLTLKIKKQKPDYVICLSVTPFTVLFSKLLIYKAIILFFYHGVLESLYSRFYPYNYVYWLKPALLIKNSNCVNIVLGNNIKVALQRLLPCLKNIEVLDHPYPPCSDHIQDSFPAEIHIAAVGFSAIEKGSDKIFELEEKLADYTSTIQLFYIGNIKNDKRMSIPPNTKITIYGGDSPLPPDEFNTHIDTMHYCIFFYPPNSYRLTASGAIFDALTHLKPVIALRNSYFEYIFNKIGDIGYLCETVDEMAEIIKKISMKKDIAQYWKQQENISKGLKYFSPEFLESRLRDIIGGINKA